MTRAVADLFFTNYNGNIMGNISGGKKYLETME